jgi:hypothetical protein
MTRTNLIVASALLAFGGHAMADTCLNTDKEKYASNDVRSFDYGKCKSAPGAPNNSYNSLSAIGRQMQGIANRVDEEGVYTDEQRAANRREQQAFNDRQSARRRAVRYGADVELSNIDYKQWTYDSTGVTPAQIQAMRQEIGDAIASSKLLEAYGAIDYTNVETWKVGDGAARWKHCEVATQLVRAYVYGDFIEPAQKNPQKGLDIAKAGRARYCGGASYWLGRIYEDGEKAVKGVDKNEEDGNDGKHVKSNITYAYGIAMINGYAPAYERMAELFRVGGPERYRGKKYFVLADFESYPYWRKRNDSDERHLMLVEYTRCLEADAANLVCARGLATLYADEKKDFMDGYTTYDAKLAAHYADYAKKLEALMVKAGVPVPASL